MEIITENKNKVVAIKYKDGVEAPFITAKGTGKNADFILQIAKENNVHIQQDSNLVEFWGNQSVGDFIPEETWDVVAKIFAFIIDSKNGVNDE